jgi:hypothetical protein
MSYDLRFKHPFACIIAGPSGSGKSFCIKLLQNQESLYRTLFRLRPSVVLRLLFVSGQRIQFHEGVPENFENVGSRPHLIILDDLLNEVYSDQVCHLFKKGCHYRNISVILITQNLFHQVFIVDISLNAKYIVLLKNVRDKRQFSHPASQVYPEYSIGMYKAYLDAIRKPHGYLLLDLSEDSQPTTVSNSHIPERRTIRNLYYE